MISLLETIKSDTSKAVFQLGIRLLLGGIFISSGWGKLNHREAFEQAVANYNLLPDLPASIYAAMLPWVEIITGVYLIIGLFIPFAAVVSALMMLSFMIAIGVVLLRGESLDNCGCFVGGRSEPLTPWKLVENLGLLALCVYLFLNAKSRWAIDHFLTKNPASDRSDSSKH